jgi:hypothetical protein
MLSNAIVVVSTVLSIVRFFTASRVWNVLKASSNILDLPELFDSMTTFWNATNGVDVRLILEASELEVHVV